MSGIGIAYTSQAGQSYNVVFDQFSGAEIARVYDASAEFRRSSNGTQLLTGRAGKQKHIWAVAGLIQTSQAVVLDEMFQAWDTDRSAGHAAAVGVTDETFGATFTASAVISTPPTFSRSGPHLTTASIGLTEV